MVGPMPRPYHFRSDGLPMVYQKCFSLIDLLHRLHCMHYNYVMSENKHGWAELVVQHIYNKSM